MLAETKESLDKKEKSPWYRRLAKHLPVRVITGRFDNEPYLIRYKLFRIPWLFAIFIHHIVRSDDDIILHDHPWPFWHKILEGEYDEQTAKGTFRRKPGYSAFHGYNYGHRLDMPKDVDCDGVWTLFIRGPKLKRWGFICEDGRWMFWKDHIKKRNDKDYEC